MTIINRHTNEKKLDAFLIVILFLSFSLQNKTTLNITVLTIGSIWLNIFDAVILMFISLLLFRFVYIKRRKLVLYEWTLIGLFFIFLLVGILNGNQLGNIMYNARTFLYLILFLFITKNFKGDRIFFFKLFSICSLLTSTIFFYTFFSMPDFMNFPRLIHFNFTLVLIYIAFSIFLFSKENVTIYTVLNIFYGSVAIFLTQTRTLIIPLVVLLLIFAFLNFFNKTNTIKAKVLIVIFITLSLIILLSTSLSETLTNRFESISLDKESTLDLRINSFNYNYETMFISEKFLGKGLGGEIEYFSGFNNITLETYSLELYFGEIFVKYGFIGLILLNAIFSYIVYYNRRKLPKAFIVSIIVILASLSISGLSGTTGFAFLGIILGLIANKHVWSSLDENLNDS